MCVSAFLIQGEDISKMSIHEECGIFGVYSDHVTDAACISYYGLYALQHRGQESCGIIVNDDGVFISHKDLGLVGDVFTEEVLRKFPQAGMAVGHTRYGTTGAANRRNCQPLEVNHQKGRMAVAHNGNLSNAAQLRSALEMSGAIFHTSTDTETIAYILTRERLDSESIEEAVDKTMDIIEGAYSLIIMSPQKLICARDPHGFRPLCYGITDDGIYIAASETAALEAAGAKLIRDVDPGEIIIFSRKGIEFRRSHCGTAPKRLCIFEYIYFARPDSVIDGVSVHKARENAGRILAETHPVQADIVIGVPDSGIDAALGFSRESGIPYGIGFIKNKYIGRTFIEPDGRRDKVRIKLSAIREVVRGKKVVLVDDSIVRGTTMGRIARLLRESGASEIHVRVSAPPFMHPCYYGTDIDSQENLIACKYSINEIASIIHADSLGYLPVDRLGALCSHNGYCSACFTGEYPTDVTGGIRRDRFEHRLSERTEETDE